MPPTNLRVVKPCSVIVPAQLHPAGKGFVLQLLAVVEVAVGVAYGQRGVLQPEGVVVRGLQHHPVPVEHHAGAAQVVPQEVLVAEPLAGGAHHPLGVQDVVRGPITPVHARPLVVALHGIILLHGKLGSGWAVNVRNIFGSLARTKLQTSPGQDHRLDTTWKQPTPSKGSPKVNPRERV